MPRPLRAHDYAATVTWTGNDGTGTSGYRDYRRDHDVTGEGKHVIAGSSDRAFRGDATRWNPEELLVASLAQCHMLAYLHLAADAGVVVLDYVDAAVGRMVEDGRGGGQFESVTLRPVVTIADEATAPTALALHHDVPEVCFIARSVNFPVHHEPTIDVRP